MKSNTHLLATGFVIAAALALNTGCAGPAKSSRPAAEQAGKDSMPKLAGKVVETVDAGGYTYVCLERNGEKTWAAIPTTKVTIGQELELQPGMNMGKFTSKALDRTWDSMIFSGGPVTATTKSGGHPGMPAGHAAMPGAKQKAPATPPAKEAGVADIMAGKVVETHNVGPYTYICLEKGGQKGWVAVPTTEVKVGEEIEVKPGTPMGQFTSKSLNRTFENILFSSGVVNKP